MLPRSIQPSERPVALRRHPDDRAWFLKNSRWEDSTSGYFAPANALEERLPVRLRWDFELQDGAASPTRATPRCCERPASN
jgi:hypothetical protein